MKSLRIDGSTMQFKVGDLFVVKKYDKLYNNGIIVNIVEDTVFIKFHGLERPVSYYKYAIEDYLTRDEQTDEFNWTHYAV